MSYQGGKQKLGKRIYKVLDTLEEYFEYDERLDYLEPFVGFCGVMKHFGQEGNRKMVGYDANKDIIAMWNATKRGWKPPEKCCKTKYEKLKRSKRVSAERGFIGVACSYSGIYFVGYRGTQTYRTRSGKKNVDSAEMNARSVNKIAKMVKKVQFKSGDYVDLDPHNMLIYCDPPYASNDYQQSEFFKFDSDEFWKTVRKWSEDNIVVISEYKAPKDFKMIWQSKTNVMHHGKKNIKVERLFIHEDLYDELDISIKKEIKQF